jgi:hypothetical protein
MPKRLRSVLSYLAVVIAIIVSFPRSIPLSQSVVSKIVATSDDIIYTRWSALGSSSPTPLLYLTGTGGSETPLTDVSKLGYDSDLSPDGTKIAYVHMTPDGITLATMNSDGSGAVRQYAILPYSNQIASPRWSPDGHWIAYITKAYHDTSNAASSIMKIAVNGSTAPINIFHSSELGTGLAWSPDSQRLAFSNTLGAQGPRLTQLAIINADGANMHPASGVDYTDNQIDPAWSPDGRNILITSEVDRPVITRLNSSDNFAHPDATEVRVAHGTYLGRDLHLSRDGQTIVYTGADWRVYTAPATGSGKPTVHTMPSESIGYPVFAPSHGPAISVNPLSVTDYFLTRGVTIHLDATAASGFQYGWSASNTTPPSGSLQVTYDLTTRQGILNYRNVTPDSDWFLWTRALNGDGSPSTWLLPVKVHTPNTPIWVGLGDSYSSGHHQEIDDPYCPKLTDVRSNLFGVSLSILCHFGSGPKNLKTESATFSWVTRAVQQYNQAESVPSQWAVKSQLLAMSGMTTTQIVANQLPKLRLVLAKRSDSWNFVSMTGGGDDAGFSTGLAHFYGQHWNGLTAPWTVKIASNCPDTQSIYANAITAGATITNNLNTIVDAAVMASASVRIIDVGYAYALDADSPCYPDSGTNAGIYSLTQLLNSYHKAITSSNVSYVDLTAATSLGTCPVTCGYLQLTRLYGYPHPSDRGQNLIASTVVGLAKDIS